MIININFYQSDSSSYFHLWYYIWMIGWEWVSNYSRHIRVVVNHKCFTFMYVYLSYPRNASIAASSKMSRGIWWSPSNPAPLSLPVVDGSDGHCPHHHRLQGQKMGLIKRAWREGKSERGISSGTSMIFHVILFEQEMKDGRDILECEFRHRVRRKGCRFYLVCACCLILKQESVVVITLCHAQCLPAWVFVT